MGGRTQVANTRPMVANEGRDSGDGGSRCFVVIVAAVGPTHHWRRRARRRRLRARRGKLLCLGVARTCLRRLRISLIRVLFFPEKDILPQRGLGLQRAKKRWRYTGGLARRGVSRSMRATTEGVGLCVWVCVWVCVWGGGGTERPCSSSRIRPVYTLHPCRTAMHTERHTCSPHSPRSRPQCTSP